VGTRGSSRRGKVGGGREADHSPSSTAKVKNVQSCTSTAPFTLAGTFEDFRSLVNCIVFFYRELLRLFINSELIKWSGLCDVYETELKQGSAKYKPTDVFDSNTEEGQKRWKDLRSRVVEHVSIRYFKVSVNMIDLITVHIYFNANLKPCF
jgi:hypothetical protein